MSSLQEHSSRWQGHRQPRSLDAWLKSRSDRCPGCGFHVKSQGCACAGLAAKAKGQDIAANAHPDERSRVEAAIRQLAATGMPFSANDARAIHGVKGGVVGAAFTALRKEGVIKPIGDETSTDPGTHGHRVYRWQGVAA